MKRSHAWFITIGVAIASGGAGFWFGMRAGANIGLLIDSAPRGSISLYHLQGIASGKTTNTVIGLESDVDTALLWNYRLEKHPLYPLLEPLWGFPIAATRESLTRLADYRRGHVSPLRPEALEKPEPQTDKDREFHAWLIDSARQNQEIISEMVGRYATKPTR